MHKSLTLKQGLNPLPKYLKITFKFTFIITHLAVLSQSNLQTRTIKAEGINQAAEGVKGN